MKYAIVFSSRTGNTAQLAEVIQERLPQADCVYCGAPNDKPLADCVLFVGFWTDKGNCDEATRAYLQGLHGQRVFLFGTAGFGGSSAYFAQILDTARAGLDATVEVLGSYMCQGKMPPSVLERYTKMLAGGADTARIQGMIDNYHSAEPHPDQVDLDKLRHAVDKIIKEYSNENIK